MEEDCVMNKKRNIMDIINKTIFVEEEVEEEVVEKKDKKSAEKKTEPKKVESRPEKVVENKNNTETYERNQVSCGRRVAYLRVSPRIVRER